MSRRARGSGRETRRCVRAPTDRRGPQRRRSRSGHAEDRADRARIGGIEIAADRARPDRGSGGGHRGGERLPWICSRRLIRNSAARRAERGPSPGSFASSWISVSSSDIGGKRAVQPRILLRLLRGGGTPAAARPRAGRRQPRARGARLGVRLSRGRRFGTGPAGARRSEIGFRPSSLASAARCVVVTGMAFFRCLSRPKAPLHLTQLALGTAPMLGVPAMRPAFLQPKMIGSFPNSGLIPSVRSAVICPFLRRDIHYPTWVGPGIANLRSASNRKAGDARNASRRASFG